MPALKDIASVRYALENSRLAASPIWNLQADKIVPAQLSALRAKLKHEGYEGIEELFETIGDALDKARQRGEIARDAEILSYCEPKNGVITSGALRRGFERMTRPTPAAILFGLEVKLEATQIVTLTWEKVKILATAKKLTPYACQILASQPRHISSKYVFWKERKGAAEPLFGLELEVFEEFGMVWAELQGAYQGIIWNDEL